ncbi:MAG: CPBP family intramembrane metalloprotease [Methanophagales archaeon ANME-1-THS]|nr:MAG: CPBP family intramembrane metalloprotease [Methanophagales archaeon ANME-1-THS]
MFAAVMTAVVVQWLSGCYELFSRIWLTFSPYTGGSAMVLKEAGIQDEAELESLLVKEPNQIAKNFKILTHRNKTSGLNRSAFLGVDSEGIVTLIAVKLRVDKDQLREALEAYDRLLELGIDWIADTYKERLQGIILDGHMPHLFLIAPDFDDTVVKEAKYIRTDITIRLFRYVALEINGTKEIKLLETPVAPVRETDTKTKTKPRITRGKGFIPFSYLVLIITSELITSLLNPNWGLFCHGIVMFTLFGHAAFLYTAEKQRSYLLMSIALAPLIRIISLYAPLSKFYFLQWFLILSIPLFVSAFLLIWFQHLNERDVGLVLKLRQIPMQGAISCTGILFGYVEYYILKPNPLIGELSFRSLIAPIIIMLVYTGFMEELIFRGIIQHHAIAYFNSHLGILFPTILFTVMHIGNLSVVDIALVFLIGYFYAYAVKYTGSIAGVSISHGLTNIFLFLLMPLVVMLGM